MGYATSGNAELNSPGSPASRTLSEENVAMRVAWEMRRRGWSQERMAQELTNAGCPTHQSAISKIVNPKPDGSRRVISVDEAIAMARVFGIPLEELPLPPEMAEGRDLHELGQMVAREGRKAKDQCAQFLLAWARLRHRLSQQNDRTFYEEFLAQRKVGAEEVGRMVQAWCDRTSWRDATSAYHELERTLQALGAGQDVVSPASEAGRRHGLVADLLRARELFASRLTGTPVRVVPDLVYHFAQTLVRADLLEVAIPVIDAYEQGTAYPVDDVVAEIDRRLQEIVDRVPENRAQRLESLAARIGLLGRGHETHGQQMESATKLGVSLEDYRDARQIGKG